ncbi:uncharacterized protein LOC62_05G007667 [Vanrija pseudolonga]|uniref:Uncharacterized protein n=1 Tax=Vanrija pseudolonga TaxID=143232 RepID=A0AAF1BK17_9TREE|nr:hypothetical protein LOC62_05G007667 [Vanrija pseudolonga]
MPADPRTPPFSLSPPPSPPKPSFLRRLFCSGDPEEPDYSAYYARPPSPAPSARSTSSSAPDAGPSRIHPAWAYYGIQAPPQAMDHRPLPPGDSLPKGLPGRGPKPSPSYALHRTPPTEPDPYIMNARPEPRPLNYHKLSATERKYIDWDRAHQKKRIEFEQDQERKRAKQAKKVAAEQAKAAKKRDAAARAKAVKEDAERVRNYEKFLAYEHWAKRHGFLPPDGETKEKKAKPPPKPEYERYPFMLQPVMNEFGVFRPHDALPGGPGYGEQWPGMSRTMHMALTEMDHEDQLRLAMSGHLWTV